MRQAMLVFAVAIGSPLAMAQSAAGKVESSVTTVAARQPQAAAAAADHGSAARKPLSPIGRALADLLREANLQRAQADVDAPHAVAKAATPPAAATPQRAIDNATTIDADAASRARLAAETERAGVP